MNYSHMEGKKSGFLSGKEMPFCRGLIKLGWLRGAEASPWLRNVSR